VVEGMVDHEPACRAGSNDQVIPRHGPCSGHALAVTSGVQFAEPADLAGDPVAESCLCPTA
jgi:hypothetical protein